MCRGRQMTQPLKARKLPGTTNGSRLRRVKTCLLPANTHKSRRKTQNSFAPHLTQKCPALLLRCPVCALPSVRLRCTPTAATRSGRCIRLRRRSHRSPIIQNGKLVGAVTHVLVNDPTTGYGIFIENKLDAAAEEWKMYNGQLWYFFRK